MDEDCQYERQPYTCQDCARFANDPACMTAEADDSAYIHPDDGEPELCGGFIDKSEVEFERILFEWTTRGYNIDEKFANAKEHLLGIMEKWRRR
jgi:hypothetical protein